MFLAGLEMDMEDFKKNRMKSVVFGLLTFLIPMALGIWSSSSTWNPFSPISTPARIIPII